MGRTCALAAVGLVLGAPVAGAAAAQDRTATVTGVLFDDQNKNGVRDAGEPGLPGLAVRGDTTVVTDAEGRYELTGLLLDETYSVWLPVAAHHGALTLSKPAAVARDGWVSGWIDIPIGVEPEVTHDIGYGRWGANQEVGLRPDGDLAKVRVGDKFRLVASTTTHEAPGYGGVMITVPPGMHVVHKVLNPGMAYDWLDTRHVRMFGLRNQEPGHRRDYWVEIATDRAATGEVTAVVTHDENTDTVAHDNFKGLHLVVKPRGHVQPAVAHRSTPIATPPTARTYAAPVLANTGVRPQPYLVAALVMLGLGVALVGAARTKPRVPGGEG